MYKKEKATYDENIWESCTAKLLVCHYFLVLHRTLYDDHEAMLHDVMRAPQWPANDITAVA